MMGAVLLAGCAGEDANEQARYAGVPGSDSFRQMLASEDAPNVAGSIDGRPPAGSTTAVPGGAALEDPGEAAPGDDYADTDPSALTDFRETLDPHGQWIEDPTYGTMWQPFASEVGPDFAPYVSNGHWTYDDEQYTWVSDYGWGWAPFHYGRWVYGSVGWGWIPGRAYAPSWVTWRVGYPGFGYVGWAPMPPTWYWGPGGAVYGLGAVPQAPYVFCGVHDVFAPGGLQQRIVTAPKALQAVAGQTHSYAPPAGSGGGNGGGRYPAHPTVAGPTPQSLQLSNNEVAHLGVKDPQISRAQQFAHPSGAVAMGGHAPGGSNAASIGAGARGAAVGSSAIPGGAVAGHAQISRGASMPAYGGSPHAYYRGGATTHLGGGESYYGHGGSSRTFSPSTGHPTGTFHPQAVTPQYVPPQTKTGGGGHFGGHYGGGHGGGGHR